MRDFFRLLSSAALLLLALTAPADEEDENDLLTVVGEAKITFSGRDPFSDFSGQVTSHRFELKTDPDRPGAADMKSVWVEIDVEKMDTGSKTKNKHMHAMFEADKFPLIRGRLALNGKTPPGGDDEEPPAVPLIIEMHGVSQKVKATVTEVARKDDQLRVILDFPVYLTKFGIDPPRVLGFLKVRNRIDVKAVLQFAPAGEATPQAPEKEE